jgi:hypothetical protein
MTQDSSAEADLFEALSAISIAGPDADNVLWVTFKKGDDQATLSIKAGTVAGDVVGYWREAQSAALAKAILARASVAKP